MSMYALQVMTGMEAEITRKLRGKGVDAKCPQERRMIRRGGKWQEQLYTLFPSYIFVNTPDVYRVYYAVRHEDGVLHWLGATKGTPEALSAHEEANILWLAGDGPLPPSEAEMQADGTLDFTSGPSPATSSSGASLPRMRHASMTVRRPFSSSKRPAKTN